eukprot:g7463.t1
MSAVEEDNANGNAAKGGLIAGGARGPFVQEQALKIGDAEEGDEDNVNPAWALPLKPLAPPLTPPAEKLWSSKAGKWVAKKWVAKEYPALGTEIHQLVQASPDISAPVTRIVETIQNKTTPEGSTQEEIPDEVKTEINNVVMNEVIMNSEIIPAVTEDLLVVDTMLANTLEALFSDWTLPDPEFQAVVREANQEGNEHVEEEPRLYQAIEYLGNTGFDSPGSSVNSYMSQLDPLFSNNPSLEPRPRLLAILLDAARACRGDFPFKRTSPSDLREFVIHARKLGVGWPGELRKLAAGTGTPAELELQQLEKSFPNYVRCLVNSMNSVLRPTTGAVVNRNDQMSPPSSPEDDRARPTIGAVNRNDQMSPASSPEDDRAARDICDKNQLEATWFHDWNLWPLPKEREEGTPAQEPLESGSLAASRPLKSGTLDALKQDIFSHVKLAKVLEKWDNVEEFQRAMERDEPLMFQSGWRSTKMEKMPTKDQDAEGNKREKNKIDLEHLAQDTYDLLTSRRYVDDFCTMEWGRDDLGDARILPKTMRVRWANIAGWMRYAAALGYAPGVLQITDMLMSVSVLQTGHGQARPLALCSDQPDSFLSDDELLAMKAYVAMECVNYSTSTGHLSEFIQALLDMRKAWRTAVPNDPGADPNTADRARAIANAQCATTYAAARRQLQTSDDQKFKQARGDAQERVQALRNREAKKWLLAEMLAKGDGEPRMDRLSYPAKRYIETKQRCMVPAALARAAVMDACRHLEPCGPLPGIPLQKDGTFPDAMQYVTDAMQHLLAPPFEIHGDPGPVFTGQRLPYLTTERMRQDWTIVHLALSCPEDVQHRGGDGRTRGQLSREMMEAFVMKAVVDAMRGEFVTYMLTYCGFHEMRVDMDATHSGNKLPAAEYGLYPMEALADEAALRKDIVDEGKVIHADKFKTFYGFDDSVWNEDHQQVCKKGLGSVTLRAHVGGSMIVAGTKGEAPPENNQTTERDVAQDHLVYGKEDIPTSISFDRSKALFLQYVDPDWHGHTEYSARAYCAARCENINADASAATTTSEETLSHKPYCEAFTMEYNTKDGSGEGGVSCHFCHREEMEAQDPEVEREQSSRINKWSRTFRRMPIAGLDRDQLRRAVLTLAEWLARGKAEAAMIADEHDGQMQITHGEKVLELQVPKLVRLMQNSVAKDIFRPMRDDIAGYFKNKLGPYYVLHLMYLIFGLGSAGRARVQDVRKTSRVKYMSVVEAILTMTQHIYQIDGDDADDNAAGGQRQPQLGESASSGTNYKHVNETHSNVTAHAQKQEHEHDRSGDSRGPQERRSMKGRRLAELPLSQKVMTYGWMQLPQFIRAPDDEAKIVWEVLADHPSVCAIPMCNQGDCLERPIDEVFGKALGGVGTCVARYPNDNDNENSTQSQVRANGNDTSAGGEGQPAKNPVFMFQPLVPHAPENAERGTPDTEEEEEAMMDAMPKGESKKKNEKNTTEEAAGDEQGASSPSTSRSKMVHPPVATGRCLQNHQVLWEMDDLPKAHTETKQLSPFSCQRRCESNPDCGRWKHPAWDAVAWLVCKNVMKAGLLQSGPPTPSNGNEEGEEPPADGAETLRIIARNTLQGAVCNEWDKNSPENFGIAVSHPYSALNEDEMNQMIREGTLPAPRSSRMSIPGRTSQAPRGGSLLQSLARLSGTASTSGAGVVPRLSLAAAGAAGASTTAAEGATSIAAATTLTPEEEEKAKKLRETRQKNKERDVKKMLKNNITEALADAYGNLINGDDKKARNLPLPLPASDEEMRAVRKILGAEEGEEIAPSVNQFRDALRKGAKK